MNDICKLNDTELEAVAGGMTCATAYKVAKIHEVTAKALAGLGDKEGAAYFNGMAEGAKTGACMF
jgi:hypothetical protein